MKLKILFRLFAMILLIWACSSGLKPDKMYTLSEIKHHARNGQTVTSQGILTERKGKREFIVTDNHVTMKINLSAYKKRLKTLEKNSKIVFSGTFRNMLFAQPEIEVTYLQVVEEFK
jgi:uncharacterized protein YdeI (BOF family)